MIIEIDANLETAFNICENVLNNLEIEIDEINIKEKYIYGSTNSGLLSWGEEIELYFDILKENRISIKVTSEAKAQLITWGKNDKNICNICDSIMEKSTTNK